MGSCGCSDVCELVCSMLAKFDFPIDWEDEDHSDILDALLQCELVKCSQEPAHPETD